MSDTVVRPSHSSKELAFTGQRVGNILPNLLHVTCRHWGASGCRGRLEGTADRSVLEVGKKTDRGLRSILHRGKLGQVVERRSFERPIELFLCRTAEVFRS